MELLELFELLLLLWLLLESCDMEGGEVWLGINSAVAGERGGRETGATG